MSQRNIDYLFASQKRKIFEQWRLIAKQNKAFLLCIKNVLEKSMYMKGFVNVKNSFRFDGKSDKLFRNMSMIFLKYSKQTTCNYFGLWKENSLKTVLTRAEKLFIDNNRTIEKFSDRIHNIKNQNTTNVEEYLNHRNLANIFKCWKNIKFHLKIKNKKE